MVGVLMGGIFGVAFARHCSNATNPLLGSDQFVQLHKNFVQNSVEQFAVGFISLLILSTYLEKMQQMVVIPLFVINFVVARIVYRIGYGIHPQYRELGMVMTMSPTIVVATFDVYFMMTKGIAFTIDY